MRPDLRQDRKNNSLNLSRGYALQVLFDNSIHESFLDSRISLVFFYLEGKFSQLWHQELNPPVPGLQGPGPASVPVRSPRTGSRVYRNSGIGLLLLSSHRSGIT